MSGRQAVQNAGDPEQVKEAALRQKDKAEQEKDDLLGLLSVPQGRRFILKILGSCRVWETGLCDPHAMSYREGAREIGVALLSEILKADPKAYYELAKLEKQG